MKVLLIVLAVMLPSLATGQSIAVTPHLSGLSSPVGITHAGDGSSRLFITLQDGRIMLRRDGSLLSTPFLDIRSLVLSGGERGLLSAAFHPRYEENGLFFVNYTNLSGDTVVARYRVSATNPDRADPSSVRVLFMVDQPYSNHNGGQMHFGPDGYLWIAMGDGGSSGDPHNFAQNLDSLLGKLLRIDVDTGNPYSIPPGNPFASGGGRAEIFSRGLRNPWRFSFDRFTGDLYIGDVGQNRFEEIHFTPNVPLTPKNYGWRIMEGMHCFNPPEGCSTAGLDMPILEYGRGDGCSVTGGYIYRGWAWPSLRGIYFYGDYCSGKIWGARRDVAGNWSTTLLADTTLNISAFGEDEQGELYVADHNGSIWRIESTDVPARRRLTRRGAD